MIEKTNLDTKSPVGNGVATPEFTDGTTLISTKTADTTNSDTNLNQSASEKNLSAQYKYPNKSAGGDAQY